MSNHLKRFTNHDNYTAYISTGAAVLPNVCVCDNESEIHYNKFELITFTIDSVQYQAESGMTWGDWVNSNYNTDNKFDTRFGMGEYWIIIRNERDKFVVLNNNQQTSKDMILSNNNYITKHYTSEPE